MSFETSSDSRNPCSVLKWAAFLHMAWRHTPLTSRVSAAPPGSAPTASRDALRTSRRWLCSGAASSRSSLDL